MALPPEPIDEVLPEATDGVIAEVARVTAQDPTAADLERSPEATDVPEQAPRQTVELTVTDVLFGSGAAKGAALEAEKPASGYLLRAGAAGPFLLKLDRPGGRYEILGRYGPDTWPADEVAAAVERHGRR